MRAGLNGAGIIAARSDQPAHVRIVIPERFRGLHPGNGGYCAGEAAASPVVGALRSPIPSRFP